MRALKLSLVFTVIQVFLTVVLFTANETIYTLDLEKFVVILAFLSTLGAIIFAARTKSSGWGILLLVLNIMCLFFNIFLLYMSFSFSFRY